LKFGSKIVSDRN